MAELAHDSDAWRELVDLKALVQWMAGKGLGKGATDDAQPLSGGTQNILLVFSRSGRRYVLRRPPRKLRPESNKVMLREMQVLSALGGSDIPHPGFIAGES